MVSLFLGLTLVIDILTLMFFAVRKEKKVPPSSLSRKVSAMIPCHAEKFEDILKTLRGIYREKYELCKVVVCGDPDTPHEIKEQVMALAKKKGNLFYASCPHRSKAMKINYVAQHMDGLGDFLYVRDCRVVPENDCIRKMISSYDDERIAAITSYGTLDAPSNIISRFYHYGKEWINEIGKFRKNAQQKRKAVFVVCGASSMYKVSVLRKLPMPHESKTEDTHYTWTLQNHGYMVRVQHKAHVSAPDMDGPGLIGIRNQARQLYRWSSGTFQCVYVEKKNLPRHNKRLLWSTLLPGLLEAAMYSLPLALLPVLFYYYPYFAAGFLIGDTVFSLLATLIIMPKKIIKTILLYPAIMFYKYVSTLVFLSAFFAVTFQYFTGQKSKWSNEWKPLQTR